MVLEGKGWLGHLPTAESDRAELSARMPQPGVGEVWTGVSAMRERGRARKGRRLGRAKAAFWIGGFSGGYERFELHGRVLRHDGEAMADDRDQRLRCFVTIYMLEFQ